MKYLAFCDTETTNTKDFEAEGVDIRKVGTELHVFRDGVDTEELPEVRIKCISLVLYDCDNTYVENGVVLLKNEPVFEAVYTDMDEFWCKMSEISIQYMYFHNLKFDESYFANPMLNNGMDLSNGWHVEPMEKDRAMSDMGKLYSMSYLLTKGKRHRIIKMRDSAKIYNDRLARIAKDFGMEKGHEALTVGITRELLDYCLMDSRIMGTAMVYYMNMCRKETNGTCRYGWLTAARTTYELFFKDLEGQYKQSHLMSWFAKEGHPVWLREAYKGASPLLDKAIRTKILRDVMVFDVNSMYPYQMFTKPLPIGRPVPITEDRMEGRLWVACCSIEARVKEDRRGCYLVKRKVNDDTLLDDIEFYGVPQYITNVDYQLIMENYDIERIEWYEIWAYDSIKGLPARYISKWFKAKVYAKERGDGAMSRFAKLMMNSLYGKFGSRDSKDMLSATYELNEKGALRKVIIDNPTPKKKGGLKDSAVDKYGYYLPWAAFITAYARKMLVDSINTMGWEHVCYTDTDSIHVHGITEDDAKQRLAKAGFRINKTALGAFDLETKNVDGKYYRNKGYCLFNKDGTVKKPVMAGATGGWENATINDFDKVQLVQVRSYNVRGGIFLKEADVSLDNDMMVHRVKPQRQIKLVITEPTEDMVAYLEDIRYDEKDPYWRRHVAQAYEKQMMEEREMRDWL